MSSAKMERQRKLGPAPIASFEDLADADLSSPESKGYRPMPDICEEHPISEASASTSTAQTPTTPRIDVEQASSPSQNESGDSTPERELFGLDSGHLSSSFLEGAADVDLRSSAEELTIPYAGRKAPGPSAMGRRKVSWDAGDGRRREQEHATIERKVSSGTGRSSAEPPHRDTRLSSVSSGTSALSALSASRRSPSPHRMLVETSFCGPKTQAAAVAEVERELERLESDASRRPSLLNPSTWFGDSRSNSPLNSPISPTSIRAFMIKYATEPRSRPTSPMGWTSNAASPTPTPTPGLTASDSMTSRWLASPRLQRRASSPHRTLLETSFCGHKQIQVPGDEVAPRGPSPVPTLLAIHARPVKYATEPRSRPTSPTVHRSLLSSPVPPAEARRGSQSSRCVSPMIETSFCGPKRILRQDSDEQLRPVTLPGTPSKSGDLSRSGSLRPVRYATEPRSRPTSPAPSLNYPPDSPRLRSKSPAPVETSFCGSVRRQESIPAPPASAPREVTQVSIHPQPVKYSTEPRSRSTSPVPPASLLGNHCPSPGPGRRSPSMIVETSFIGPKKQDSIADRESLASEPPSRTGSFRFESRASPVRYVTEPRSRSTSPAPKLLSGTPESSRRNLRSPSPHRTLVETSFCGPKQIPRQDSAQLEAKQQRDPVQPRPVSPSASTDSMSSEISLARHMRPDLPVVDNANEKAQEVEEFVAQWPEQPVTQAPWPVMSTFEPSPAPSEESPPSQNSNGHIVPAANNPTASPAKPGRHLPKPVACPKPPQNFHPHPLESSPVLARKAVEAHPDTATPSPSSPFPSRRTSVNSGFFHHDEERQSQDDCPPVKEKKNRSVLSVLFGKKRPKEEDDDADVKPAARNLTLPVKSRESSPGRSIGESGDDLDDEDGFQHEILEAGNESGDNMLEAETNEAGKAVPHEELGLFHQDSIEDELPYVPTTLPIERPVAPVITPVRMRISQLQTTPIERPRCSVTFAPRPIAEFVQIARADSLGAEPDAKLKVSLPRAEREDSVEAEAPPPVKVALGGVKWEAFSEQVFRTSRSRRRMQPSQECIPEESPETPTECKKIAEIKTQWVNVEELPEPVKAPKAIKVFTTAPSTERERSFERTAGGDGIDEEAKDEEDDQQSAPLLQDEEDDVDDAKAALLAPEQRKDSVSSETALLREIEEPEDRSQMPEVDDDASAVSNREERSQSSSSLDELDSNLDDAESESVSLVRNNLLAAAPFGMDLDVPSNRSSIAIPSDAPSPDELSISLK